MGFTALGEREPVREKDGTVFASSTWRGSVTMQPHASGQDELQVGVRCGWRTIECNGSLPRTGPLPERLHETYLSGSYRHVSSEKWIYGASLQIGGAGDRFASRDTSAFMANLFLRIPVFTEDGVVILLNESNSRTTLNYIPIPGIAYHLVRGKELNALIGIPFMSVFWKPTDWSDLMAFGSPFGTAMMGGGVRPFPSVPLRFGVSMEWVSESYRRVDRIEDHDVLYLREAKLVGRAGVQAGPRMGLDLYYGWIFQREAREARSYAKADDNRLELPAGPVMGCSGRFRF
jgi:hypothetical protein